jgi:integrase
LAHWWPGYLKSLSGLKGSTVTAYEIAWRLRVQPRFGATAVRRIRVSQVEDWIAELSAEGLSASKVLETYGVLKRLLDRAVRDRALPHNPCGNRSTRLPRHTAKDRPVLSPAEVDELASAMKHPLDGTLVRVLAYGGLRIGEAFALQHQDFDASSHTVRVHRSVRDIGRSGGVGQFISCAGGKSVHE